MKEFWFTYRGYILITFIVDCILKGMLYELYFPKGIDSKNKIGWFLVYLLVPGHNTVIALAYCIGGIGLLAKLLIDLILEGIKWFNSLPPK